MGWDRELEGWDGMGLRMIGIVWDLESVGWDRESVE